MNGFTVYKEYFELITLLSDKEQSEMWLAIMEYMFEDKEPVLNDKQMKIFNNLKRPLSVSKNQSKRRTKQEPNENQEETKTKPKRNQKETKQEPNENPKKTHQDVNVIVNVKYLLSNLKINNINNKNNIYKLLEEYLQVRKKNKYIITNTVVLRLVNKLNEYGKNDEEKIEIITNAINGAWKDFYPLKKEQLVQESKWERTKREFLEGEAND